MDASGVNDDASVEDAVDEIPKIRRQVLARLAARFDGSMKEPEGVSEPTMASGRVSMKNVVEQSILFWSEFYPS
jgi:hypothetical protein